MKSLLIFLALLTVPLLAGAQSLFPSPSPTGDAPLIETPPATTPQAAPPPTNAKDAAATVPLQDQTTGPQLDKNLPPIPLPDSGHSGGGHSGSHKAHAGGSPGVASTFMTEQELLVRIKLRQAQTKALNDPGIQADWEAAHGKKTDPERRAALEVYYNHLYGRMLKIEPKLADRINNRKMAAISRLTYTRLGDVDPSEDPYATPTPAAAGSDFGSN